VINLRKTISRVDKGSLVAIVLFLLLSFASNLNAWIDGPTNHLLSGTGGDGGQFIWFLKWIPYALIHGLNPNQSLYLNMPHGITLASLTSMPVLALLVAPITLLFGPILSYNLLLVLAIFGSSVATFFVAKRWVSWWFARFIAGLLFGFSPYVVGQSTGHIFLTTGVAFPILLLCFDELFNRQTWKPKKLALILALAIVFEIGVSIEMLADAAVVASAVVILIAAFKREEAKLKLPYIRKVIPLTALYAGPFILSYMALYLQGAGLGAARAPQTVANLSADLATFILPGANQLLHFGIRATGDTFVNFSTISGPRQDIAENGAYIGIPLLALVGLSIWMLRRRAAVIFMSVGLLVSLVVAMGAHLRIAGHQSVLILPFFFMSRHKSVFFNSMVPIRYMDFAFLFIAVIVAIGIESIRTKFTIRSVQFGAVALIAALSIISLLPPWPQGASAVELPAWFNQKNLALIPERSTLLTFPMAHDGTGQPMLWQAMSDFKFNIPGAEAGSQAINNAPLLIDLAACQALAPGKKLNWRPTYAADKANMATWKVRTIVVPLSVSPVNQTDCAVTIFTKLTNKQPHLKDGSLVWLNLR
jgi:hypothetical protein